MRLLTMTLALWGGLVQTAGAEAVGITPEMAEVQVTVGDGKLTIARGQDVEAMLTGEFARTQRACPPNCVQPMQAAPGVETFGELEVIGFLQAGQGLLIDSRLPARFAEGSLPGAVNVPYATLAPDNSFHTELLKALGAQVQGDNSLDFTDAKTLTVYCDGNWNDAARTAIGYLLAAGYPAEKIKYYRGGMQDWLHLGLTVVVAGNPG